MPDVPPHHRRPDGCPWRVERVRGAAQALHDLDVPARRLVRVHEVEAAAVVLGSTQRDVALSDEALRALGAVPARRRSGGGAVWLAPGLQVWVDLVVPAGDPLWCDDVVEAAAWVGELWCTALAALAPRARLEVHRGAALRHSEGRLACFAGLAPGEVCTVDDGGGRRKVVGVSQRRTRTSARFQSVAYLRWDPEPLVRSLDLGDLGAVGEASRDALRAGVAPVPSPADAAGEAAGAAVLDALLDALSRGR